MAKLKHVGILFFAKLHATVMAFVGLLAGILYSFGGFFSELSTGTLNTGTALAFMALIGMPIMFSALGFLLGVLGALFYNRIAKWTGGLETDILIK